MAFYRGVSRRRAYGANKKSIDNILGGYARGAACGGLSAEGSLCDPSRPGRILRPNKTIKSFY